MAQKSQTGSFQNEDGFTLMELLAVLFIVALLASLSAPLVSSSITRAKEAALLETLAVTRRSIDAYYSDNDVYPETLETLVDEKYLRTLPHDPFIGDSASWLLVFAEEGGGILDLHSVSSDKDANNSAYKDW